MITYVNTIQTLEGKYVTQVLTRNGKNVKVQYETPEYLTRQMAVADAWCWKEFHMNEAPKVDDTGTDFTICEDDKVFEGGYKLNTQKVCDTITRINGLPTTRYKVGPLTGLKAELKGFRLEVYMPGKFWRKFDVIKSEKR